MKKKKLPRHYTHPEPICGCATVHPPLACGLLLRGKDHPLSLHRKRWSEEFLARLLDVPYDWVTLAPLRRDRASWIIKSPDRDKTITLTVTAEELPKNVAQARGEALRTKAKKLKRRKKKES